MNKRFLFPVLFLCLLQATCKKQKDEPQLPPETQTGAYTFGCKVNGKVFVPQDGRGKPGLYAQYVYLGEGPNGGWFLDIPATNQPSSDRESVSIETDSLLLEEHTYELRTQKGYANGSYSKGSNWYRMRVEDTGQLIITRHDKDQKILSGRFSFDATTFDGSKVHITDGRFDIAY